QCHVIDPEEFTTDVRFSFFVEDAQFLYFDLYTLTGTEIGNPRNKSVNLSVNGRFLETDYPQSSNNGLVSLGKFENEYVTVRAVIHQDFTCESFGVFGIREKVLTDAAAALPADDLHYEQGCYTVTTKGESVATLVLAIPYDEGFTAEVNGKPAEVFRVNTCETAVLVPVGEAVVELRFFPPGLKAALVLSGAGLMLFVLYALLRKRISKKMGCYLCFIFEKLTLLALAGVFLLIYVMPVAVFLVNIFI
ncbi:MAG: YfhO family protein, partial [Oscillospiraceae bacterium]|nr:YfhO family protein [Oscillospiraceae bacterium]